MEQPRAPDVGRVSPKSVAPHHHHFKAELYIDIFTILTMKTMACPGTATLSPIFGTRISLITNCLSEIFGLAPIYWSNEDPNKALHRGLHVKHTGTLSAHDHADGESSASYNPAISNRSC
jgi:hypothetical protein